MATAPNERPFASGGSIRARVLIVILYVCLISTNVGLIYRSYGQVLNIAQQNNVNLARAVTDRVDGTFAEADHILEALLFEMDREKDPVQTAMVLQPLMANHVSRSTRLKDIFIFDSLGNWLTATTPHWDKTANNRERSYFVAHRDNPSGRTRVGPPIVSKSSGEWVVPVSRRYNNSDGTFAGVILATLSIHDLRLMLERFHIGSGAITLTIGDHLLVRHPYVEKDTGQVLPAAFTRAFSAGRSGAGEAVSPIDGVRRLYSFEEATDYPVRILVASSKKEVLKEWMIWSVIQSIWTLFLCVVLYRAVIYFRRSIIARTLAEAQVREANNALSLANRELSRLAKFDALTGLANRRHFDQELSKAFAAAVHGQKSVAVILIDVDKFKEYNDHYGHIAGDEALRRISHCLQEVFAEPSQLVARYGGEELIILLADCAVDEAQRQAHRALQAVRELNIAHERSAAGRITISAGVASRMPHLDQGANSLVDEADEALYRAKRSGRDTVCVSDRGA